VNDAPLGTVVASGTARTGFPLSAENGFSDADGLPLHFSYAWLRDGEPIPGANAWHYELQSADIGARIAVRVSYVDASGFDNTRLSAPTEIVLGAQTIRGSADADILYDSQGTDSIEGGDGNDQLFSQSGADTLDGGAGWDVARLEFASRTAGWNVDFAAGTARQGDRALLLASIEAVVGSAEADMLAGSDSGSYALHEAFDPGQGNDTVDGRGGVDMVQLRWHRSQFDIERRGETMVVRRPASTDEVDTLIGIERLRFLDEYVAFGDRAVEVARVAFALWNPAIATSRYLFARGISYYDVGYSYETLIDTALGFFTTDTPQQFAERLAGNVASGRTAAEVLALMQANGGSAAGETGRAYATKLVAGDAANLRAIELAGLISNGIACDLYADGNLLFAPIGG
jgi:Ca2+-binding RTX toxin-like protein